MGGFANKVGTIGKPVGPYENGAYVGPAYDCARRPLPTIRASDLRTAQTISAVSTQAVIDPLNWLAGPIGAGISGLSAKKIFALGAEAAPLGLDAADLLARGFRNKVYLRNAQRPAGWGQISQRGLANWQQARRGGRWPSGSRGEEPHCHRRLAASHQGGGWDTARFR